MNRKIFCYSLVIFILNLFILSYGEDFSSIIKKFKKRSKSEKLRDIQFIVEKADIETLKRFYPVIDEEKDENIRVHFAKVFSEKRNKDALDKIKGMIEKDKSVNLRVACCLGLRNLKDAETIDFLTRIVLNKNEDESVRIAGLNALVFNLSFDRVKETVKKIVKDENRVIRFALVQCLKGVERNLSEEFLIELSKDNDEEIRNLSKRILEGNE